MTDKPIDKTEAAGRQLDGACRLRLSDDDSLMVHTLGFAAFGILSDLVRHREHPMNDVLDILEDQSSKMGREFREVPNSLKHADRYPNAVLEAHSEKDVHLTLALAIRLWVELGNQETEAMRKFMQLPDPYKPGYRASAFVQFAQERPLAEYEEEAWRQRLSGLTVTSSG
jgi:hypothetical protein